MFFWCISSDCCLPRRGTKLCSQRVRRISPSSFCALSPQRSFLLVKRLHIQSSLFHGPVMTTNIWWCCRRTATMNCAVACGFNVSQWDDHNNGIFVFLCAFFLCACDNIFVSVTPELVSQFSRVRKDKMEQRPRPWHSARVLSNLHVHCHLFEADTQ